MQKHCKETSKVTRIFRLVHQCACAGALVSIGACSAAPAAGDRSWFSQYVDRQGDAVQLQSVSPLPGTPLTQGNRVPFKVSVSYTLSGADRGRVSLAFLDDAQNILSPSYERAAGAGVVGRAGEITVEQTIDLPKSGRELILIVSLFRAGLQNPVSGITMRYPMSRLRP